MNLRKLGLGLIILLIFFANKLSANTSDTIHVSHYSIAISSIDFFNRSISGKTELHIISRLNSVQQVNLRLINMTVDSVFNPTQTLTYQYQDTILSIQLPQALQAGDSTTITIYYHGQPVQDGQFGGFYFSSNYAFNMGVGLTINPHNMGSAWFPCIDEFTDKATCEFFITTDQGSKAFCNGVLDSSRVNPDNTITWHWQMNQPLPTYLMSVAVAPFYTMEKISSSGIPVEWAILPQDSLATQATFVHFDSVLAGYIKAYGPYPFDKVGFVSVPFNGGAMEHATSIHIGKVFVDGTLNYETLWAHELSHMWWGDLATCSSEQEMWLNEGFASFNEFYTTELLYGKEAYMDLYRANHHQMVQLMHLLDYGYFALNNIPHAITYGNTVYLRGADVVHTLRNLMGDSAFFTGCKSYFTNRAFQSVTSRDFTDEMTAATGIDLSNFYDDWIATPGFCHFSIDSVNVSGSMGIFNVNVFTRQRQKGNTHVFNMPVECSFSDATHDTTVLLNINAPTNVFQVSLNFYPEWIALDKKEKISDAIVDYSKVISDTGQISFPETGAFLLVHDTGSVASHVRIEHNFVRPDSWIGSNPGIELSTYHYYTVDGLFSSGFFAGAKFEYDGRSSGNSAGNLDNDILTGIEDSLVIFWREGAGKEWKPVSFHLEMGASNHDKRGFITVDTLKKGEYVFGYKNFLLSVESQVLSVEPILHVYPNPASGFVRIVLPENGLSSGMLSLYSFNGELLRTVKTSPGSTELRFQLDELCGGMYFFTFCSEQSLLCSRPFVKE